MTHRKCVCTVAIIEKNRAHRLVDIENDIWKSQSWPVSYLPELATYLQFPIVLLVPRRLRDSRKRNTKWRRKHISRRSSYSVGIWTVDRIAASTGHRSIKISNCRVETFFFSSSPLSHKLSFSVNEIGWRHCNQNSLIFTWLSSLPEDCQMLRSISSRLYALVSHMTSDQLVQRLGYRQLVELRSMAA